jgi:NTE family protein
MALEEEQSVVPEARAAIDHLRDNADLEGVDALTLQDLASGAAHFSLPAGHFLFAAGEAHDGVYIVTSGRLGIRSAPAGPWDAEVAGGGWIGETAWLLGGNRSASVVALRDSEILWLPTDVLNAATGASAPLALAMARLAARRARHDPRIDRRRKRASVFVIVPNDPAIDIADLASQLVEDLDAHGSAELVWDVRAVAHTTSWFHAIEEANDFVVYAAGPAESAWTRQCCRQADVIVVAARAAATPEPWPDCIADAAVKRGARIELALLHEGGFVPGAAARWRSSLPVACHHHLVDRGDIGRLARLLTRRGVGLVLSGGGARGFAHLGVIQALREARVPIDCVGGVSIGAVIAAGVAMEWSDAEMQSRYRRCFVETNPVNDYTFPWVALTRGRKVSRLLQREYGNVHIEDLRLPFFCISADLRSARAFEHRDGPLALALRASVAIPGVMPPVFTGDSILVDGAALNNLPVDVMQRQTPGFVIGSDASADRSHPAEGSMSIFRILIYSGLANSAAGAAVQRALADVLLRPPLANVDLLNWQAFDRAIEAGYDHARSVLSTLRDLPRLQAPPTEPRRPNSLALEIQKRAAGRALDP